MSKWILGIGAACMILSLAWAQGGGQQEGPPILVVDLQKVLTSCKEHLDTVEGLRKRLAEEKQRLGGEVTQLEEAQKDILKSKITERDEDWYEAVKKLLEGQAGLKTQEAYFNLETSDRLARSLNALIRGAQQEARAVMRERKAKMVLVTKTGRIELDSEQQWQDELLRRRVLCFDKVVDISDEVLKRMDAKYAARGKPAEAVPEKG